MSWCRLVYILTDRHVSGIWLETPAERRGAGQFEWGYQLEYLSDGDEFLYN